MRMARWEHGSDFHWVPASGARACSPWRAGGLWFGSGRDALKSLVCHLTASAGCRRIWVPSYYCDAVVAAFDEVGVEVRRYCDHPLVSSTNLVLPVDLDGADVVLVVNYFGHRRRPTLSTQGVVVEDHTHDPWSAWATESQADYCFASLRKTLPIPDGGVLWSPAGKPLPPCVPPTREHRLASADRLAGMILKSSYLAGEDVDKARFRELLTRGEALLGRGPVSGGSELGDEIARAFPAQSWRECRAVNWRILATALEELPVLSILRPEEGCCPYAVTLLAESIQERDRIRRGLIDHDVYSAVLWREAEGSVGPGDHLQSSERDTGRSLSERILSLHCDGRYTPEDLEHVAAAIRTLVEGRPAAAFKNRR